MTFIEFRSTHFCWKQIVITLRYVHGITLIGMRRNTNSCCLRILFYCYASSKIKEWFIEQYEIIWIKDATEKRLKKNFNIIFN